MYNSTVAPAVRGPASSVPLTAVSPVPPSRSTLAITGQVHFASAWPAGLAPYWMLSLWIVFATTLNHSLRWLMNRPVAAALAGAIGGPLAYLAGAKLGALSIVTPAVTLPFIALLWTPAMITLSMTVMRASRLPAGRSLT